MIRIPTILNRRRVILVIGIVCLFAGMLPWLGASDGAFVVLGWDLRLPQLDLFGKLTDSFLKDIYYAFAFPIAMLGLIPPLDDIVFFAGEGRQTVRPYVVFLFYHFAGIVCVWWALRRR